MSKSTILAEIPLGNKATTLRVTLTGEHVVDLRLCSPLSTTSKVRAPTARGVAVPLAQLDCLIEALRAAGVKANELGWIGGGE